MDLMSRALSFFFVLTLVLLTCTSLSAEWLFELGTITDRFGNRVSLSDLERKDEQISRELRRTIEHLCAKDAIAEALYRGELSLIDAAVLFRSLHEDRRSWHDPQRPRPRLDDGAAWCREVIDWTAMKIDIEHSSCQADAVRQSLEAELQAHLADHGSVKLTD